MIHEAIRNHGENPHDFFTTSEKLLLFDGHCGVCTRLARFAQKASDTTLSVTPNQTPGVLNAFNLTKDQVDAAVWLIDKDGERSSGAEAIAKVMDGMGGGWARAASLYKLPLVPQVSSVLYDTFARNRGKFSRFGVTPECEEPNNICSLPPEATIFTSN